VAAESGEPPAELDPRRWLQTGAEVIEHGLPELPPQLTYQMSIPMCYWAAECCAEVTFMRFLRRPEDGHMAALTTTVPCARQDGRWVPPRGNQHLLSSYAFDPVTDPDYDRHLDGSAMTYGKFRGGDSHEPGHPASSALGHVSPAVKYLAVIQDGHQDYRPLQSHFGAWAVCVENRAASTSLPSAATASSSSASSTRPRSTDSDGHLARIHDRQTGREQRFIAEMSQIKRGWRCR
jgi:hypothetical protein